MYNSPKAAIIITCFNYEAYIRESVKSAVEQTYINKEVIVVDDGSTNAETAMVLNQLKIDYPEIKIIFQPNSGPSKARNNGTKSTDASILMHLDGDDFIDSSYLQKAIDIIESGSNISPVYAEGTCFGEINERVHLIDWDFNKIKKANFIWTCPVFSRKSWEDCNGYDENLHGNEDYELYLNMAFKGYIGKRIAENLIFKRSHDNTIPSFNKASSDKAKFNETYIQKKHFKPFWNKLFNL
ncbi:MAG: glycosyltransferase family A protein [Bacteroidota bacterium]|nr:glycosyltransferase family A protein [Bacteroidota bacterium]